MQKTALVCGAGGFIGSHVLHQLKRDGFWVRGVDLTLPQHAKTPADDFVIADLRNPVAVHSVVDRHFDEVYQFAADMGGAGYLFTGEHDADIVHNSAVINLNVLSICQRRGIKRVFFSSSACVYPENNQLDLDNPYCAEDSVYPANPDSEYGWEKLFSERLYLAYNRNHEVRCRIARYHNIFGPQCTWSGGREKAPAALCRKVAMALDGGEIEIWGDCEQTRSFLSVDECVAGTLLLMRSDLAEPVNIGSEELISINDLARMIIDISGKDISLMHVPGPIGVRGRNSDNRMVRARLGWAPTQPLRTGIARTYSWICGEVARSHSVPAEADANALEPQVNN